MTNSLKSRIRLFNILTLSTLGSIVFSGCISSYEPIERFEEGQKKREKHIESTLSDKYGENAYQSLAYGPLKVYKPESFRKLDSLYALKEDFIERNDLRGLKNSGVEDNIPSYRAEAQRDIDQVQYEIEHIYTVERNDSLNTHHSVFLFDHQDSLISKDLLYEYTFPEKYEEMHNNYLFEYHFITNRDLYISTNERQFIQYFKEREQGLVGTSELSSFITDLLKTMSLAQKINSVDFKELIKYKSIKNLKEISANITINEFGTLIALEEQERIVGYEYQITWQNSTDKVKKKSIFTYSPTLSLEQIETTKE